MASEKSTPENKLFAQQTNPIKSLFSKESPLFVDFDDDKSFCDRLLLFGFEPNETIRLLEKLNSYYLALKNTQSPRHNFSPDEVKKLDAINLKLNVPIAYYVTERF